MVKKCRFDDHFIRKSFSSKYIAPLGIAILIFLAPGRVFFSDMAPRAVFHSDTRVNGAVFHSDTRAHGAVFHSDT